MSTQENTATPAASANGEATKQGWFRGFIVLPKLNLAFFQQLVAEFLATFFFYFVWYGSVLTQNINGVTGIAQVFSYDVAAFLTATGVTYAFGQLSGAHFNPLITFTLMVALKMNWIVGIIYLIIQFLATLTALGFLCALFPLVRDLPDVPTQLTFHRWSILGEGDNFFVQFLGGFFLCMLYLFFRYDEVVPQAADDSSNKEKRQCEELKLRFFTRQNLTPLVLGLAYMALTTFSLNPWLTVVPCMIADQCQDEWEYAVGGFLASATAGVLFLLIWGWGRKNAFPSMNPVLPPIELDQ